MSRTANTPSTPADDGLEPSKVDVAITSAMELSVITHENDNLARALAANIGYQLPADSTDPDLIQRTISADMRRSVEAVLEVGRGLTVLKQVCGHGNFTARLDVMGIETRVAQKLMGTAKRFSNAASTPLLKAAGNQTKLFEMLVLDDESFEELTLTGQTGELAVDDIAKMSVKELRHALREAKASESATGKLLEQKNKKIDTLEAKGAVLADIDWTAALAGLSAQFANSHENIKLELTKANAVRHQIASTEHTDELSRAAYKALLTTHSNQLLELDTVLQMMMRDADIALQGVEV